MIQSRNFDQAQIRKSFSNNQDRESIPHLISLQKESYEKFLQLNIAPENRKNVGIQSVFNSFFPLSDSNGKVTVEFIKYDLKQPRFESSECLSAGKTFSSALSAHLRIILWHQDDDSSVKEIRSIKEQEVYLCEIPLMTETGSFVFNGAERVIVSQMRRAPGVFFDSENAKVSGSKSYTAKVIPHIGSWLDFEFDTKDILHFRIDKKRKIPATTLLRAIGHSSENIIQNFYGSFEAFIDNKGWALKFDQKLFNTKKTPHDIICAKTGELVVKEGTKINRKLLDKLKDDKFENYLLTDDALLGFVYAQDLIESETGELLLEAGSIVTSDSLQILKKLNFTKVLVINPSKSDSGPYVYNTLLVDKNSTQKDALYDIYKAVRLGESPSSVEIAKTYFDNLFFNDTRYNLSDVGRMKINHRLGIEVETSTLFLTTADIEHTISILSKIKHNDLKTDDIDNLANRRVRAVGELIENQMRIGMTRVEKSILEKINSVEVDTLMPQAIINSKPLITAVKDFFATSQLSQFMDQTNPLSDITHKRRLSALGPGGLTRERAGFEVRDVHPTHYGRICPIETPEGQNIGLINSMATYARVNDFGFIETPYRKVVNGKVTPEVHYLSAMGEVNFAIAPSNIELDNKGVIKNDLVSCRKNGEFIMLTPDKIDYIDVSTKQIVSIATTLIPFLENDDANRALMGSNMQRQAVPLLRPDAPLVGTGMEAIIATDSGATVQAPHDGIVKFVDSSKIIIEYLDKDGIKKIDICNLKKYVRTNQDTCINQRPTVEIGESVKAGQIISDGHSIANGEIALGKNVRVAFMPWNGYNFEDSIIISEKLLADDTFTSIHIEEMEVVARDTRLGPEEITRDIPNVSEEVLSKLDEEGIIHIGAEVVAGDILVGKTTPKSESPMTPEEKLLKVIFGEKASDVKDSSLYVPTGVSGTVVDVRVFLRKGIEKDERSIYIEMQQIEELTKAKNLRIQFVENSLRDSIISLLLNHKITNNLDKIKSGTLLSSEILSSLSKNQLSKIIIHDAKVMDTIENSIKFSNKQIAEIEANYNDKVAKIKAGEELGQGILKIVKVYIATKYKLQPGDKMAGRHGNKGVVSKIAPIEDMPYSADGEPVDIVLNPLGVPSRMNVGQILETHLGFASKELGKKIAQMLEDISHKKSEYIKQLRDFLLKIYTNEVESENIRSMNDEELIIFSRRIKNGVPFATGIFEGAKEEHITKLLDLAGVDNSGQIELFDGKTGNKFDRKVTVGYIYMLKLHHLVDDKIHARSIGPYSLITQQPLGGKSHFGGQRFGEMECWALQAYGAAYTLQEMLTVKSDDVIGRIKIYESIIQGNQNFNCSIPESFNVMIKEVRSLGLNIELIEE
jgi:DNA-directed RNA polymerase subunit beta